VGIEGVDVLLSIEVIEHVEFSTVRDAFLATIVDARPKVVILTTPN